MYLRKEDCVRVCHLREKEVVNCCNCKVLGCVADVEIDSCTGCVRALVVPGQGKWCGFWGREEEYVIPWCCVKKIGPDIILVEIQEKECLGKEKD